MKSTLSSYKAVKVTCRLCLSITELLMTLQMPLKAADWSFIMLQLDGASLKVPDGVPIYDLQTDIPWFFEAQAPYTDLVQRTLETNPELVELLLAPEHPKAHPEAKSILRWETNMVRPARSSCSIHAMWVADERGLALHALLCSHTARLLILCLLYIYFEPC